MAGSKLDKDLEQYRSLLETPTEFRDGFGWTTVVGIVFCGLVMLPGSIYLGLMTGGNMGAAATWVTVILFSEIARRALKALSRQEVVVLLHAATVMIAANALFPGGPVAELIYRAFLVRSEPVTDAGMTEAFPRWWVPASGSNAILQRNLFEPEWLVPLAIALFVLLISFLSRYTLGYFLFRLTSDIEQLPFPLAPIAAQGAMALAEVDEPADETERAPGLGGALSAWMRLGRRKKTSSKWQQFSLGVTIGLGFGFLQVGVPTLTGLFLARPVFLIPQPFIDMTTFTEKLLPATPTGLTLDLGIVLVGMVLPFYAVVGTFCAVMLTLVLNPILHHFEILTLWQPGMNTVNTTFANSIDFWLSFSVGIGAGIAAVSIYSTVRDIRRKLREGAGERQDSARARESNIWNPPREGRGDFPLWAPPLVYGLAAGTLIYVCHRLVPELPFIFLFVFAFLYSPFISYINARLLGIAGQQVAIPYVRETAFILSGTKGIDLWLIPMPMENYGYMAQAFRTNELTGVSFRSLVKAELVALPLLFGLSLMFWAFIWRSEPVPSHMFPYAQINWDLLAKNNVLLYSSTFVPPGSEGVARSLADTQFMKAIHPSVIGTGFGVTVLFFAVLSSLGFPTLLLYGFVRGLGQLPHFFVLEIVGAIIGRRYFQKRYGSSEWLRMVPTIMAGYFTGVGLVSMATIGMHLIKSSVSGLPF